MKRLYYWIWMFGIGFLQSALKCIDDAHMKTFTLLICLIATAFIFINFFITFLRIKDAGFSGWWTICPFANFIIAGFFPSDKTDEEKAKTDEEKAKEKEASKKLYKQFKNIYAKVMESEKNGDKEQYAIHLKEYDEFFRKQRSGC